MEPNVIKLLNPKIQKSRQISLALPRAWRLTGAVRSMTLAIGIPGDYRDHDVIKEIGSLLGVVSEIENHGPVVRARIRIDSSKDLDFVRRVEFESDDEPVEVRFVYECFVKLVGVLNITKLDARFQEQTD